MSLIYCNPTLFDSSTTTDIDIISFQNSYRFGSYKDKNHDDVTHYTTEVSVDNVEFCGGKNDNGNNQTNTQPAASAPAEETTTDDLPF